MLTEKQPRQVPEPIREKADAWDAVMENVITEGMKRVRRSQAQLVAQGLYDEQGNKLTPEIPYDMRPGSNCDVGG